MAKRGFYIILCLAWIFSSSVAHSATETTQAFTRSLKKAEKLIEQGDLLGARDIYAGLAAQSDLSNRQKKIATQHLEKANLQLVFSRFETPGSFMCTVVSGDSLYKIAKKHQTTIDLIKKSNGLSKDVIYPGMKLKIQKEPFSATIDKSENILTLIQGGTAIKHYRVATGENNSTPVGQFEIATKLINPTWYHAGAVVPPDSPENILGTRWLGFDYPGYGIHGTTLPETIGKQASHGCVRMLNREVEEIYTILPLGTKVTIKD